MMTKVLVVVEHIKNKQTMVKTALEASDGYF